VSVQCGPLLKPLAGLFRSWRSWRSHRPSRCSRTDSEYVFAGRRHKPRPSAARSGVSDGGRRNFSGRSRDSDGAVKLSLSSCALLFAKRKCSKGGLSGWRLEQISGMICAGAPQPKLPGGSVSHGLD
jgi:hypothetical protein